MILKADNYCSLKGMCCITFFRRFFLERCLFSKLIACCLAVFPCTYAFSVEENFLLINSITQERVVEQGPHIHERVTPACSFNIALSLIGYEAGILKDENTPTWDFQEGYDDFSPSWKISQSPQSWMTRSCVWYSKILALHLGLEKIQNYVFLFQYGNHDMSGGLAPPGPRMPAWISSSLKISPQEQVDFIQKILHGKLPISNSALQKTKVLLFKEKLPQGWELYGKTGLGSIRGQEGKDIYIRWFVGWIEKNQTFFPFAYQLRAQEMDFSQTVSRVKQLLMESNVMTQRS